MPETAMSYVFSVQLERYHKSMRFHWVICSRLNPDQMVSWGHASSRELAEAAVQEEMEDLRSGRTLGGRVRNKKTQVIFRR